MTLLSDVPPYEIRLTFPPEESQLRRWWNFDGILPGQLFPRTTGGGSVAPVEAGGLGVASPAPGTRPVAAIGLRFPTASILAGKTAQFFKLLSN